MGWLDEAENERKRLEAARLASKKQADKDETEWIGLNQNFVKQKNPIIASHLAEMADHKWGKGNHWLFTPFKSTKPDGSPTYPSFELSLSDKAYSTWWVESKAEPEKYVLQLHLPKLAGLEGRPPLGSNSGLYASVYHLWFFAGKTLKAGLFDHEYNWQNQETLSPLQDFTTSLRKLLKRYLINGPEALPSSCHGPFYGSLGWDLPA